MYVFMVPNSPTLYACQETDVPEDIASEIPYSRHADTSTFFATSAESAADCSIHISFRLEMNQGPRVVTLCRVSRSHSKDINRFITGIELDNAEPHVMIAFAIGRHHGGPSHHPTNWIFPQACENNPSGG
ncbi:hypothetical protein CISG_07604 [Coccidioides immitis RMSCC 3703]|uniref:Uncharacterized protein n=1 Tax=Coccidioides immitis RMSCC 3703 TaxID=454286 RepID=A0A0J8R2I0_COCIT|nr:hypothetical protein CISG_07604 [Coccidioides immitis RMSCC 3703]